MRAGLAFDDEAQDDVARNARVFGA